MKLPIDLNKNQVVPYNQTFYLKSCFSGIK